MLMKLTLIGCIGDGGTILNEVVLKTNLINYFFSPTFCIGVMFDQKNDWQFESKALLY
jgi:hypothetical protein